MSTATEELAARVVEARERTLDLVADLTDEQLAVPYLPTVNPFAWELGHAAYFQEFWVLRDAAGRAPLRPDADDLFDSIHIEHEERWRLPLPPRDDVVAYARAVRDATVELLEGGTLDERGLHFVRFSVGHEDMHAEAFTYMRQTLGYAPPPIPAEPLEVGAPAEGDARIPATRHRLGAEPGCEFCFDNERWAHEVEVDAFAVARAAVTEGEFAAFVEDGGYRDDDLWTPEGARWRAAVGAEHPVYWRRARDGAFERRHFDRWVPLEPRRAVSHVSWFEADAFARWAGRRLPTETEWEVAAAGSDPGRANVDWRGGGPASVDACPGADGDHAVRQMVGNVWEWTATTFEPYPGFAPDMYRQYSLTSFRTRKVLRGGSWATRARFVRPTLRNFFQPGRRDVVAGFRTCARSA